MKLSIVVPACNEEDRISMMLDEYLPFFTERYGSDVEVIVVVNGSTDGTERVVRDYMGRHSMIKCMVEPRRIGKGGAVRVGFDVAQGDLIGFTDADGATPATSFQDLVDNVGDFDAVIASRWLKGADVTMKQTISRQIASRAFNFMVRILFGLRLTDTQCGAKLMRRDAVRTISSHLGVTQWAFDVDLLFQLKRSGYKIKEIPTTWHDVEGSKILIGRASLEMFLTLLRLRLIYSPFKGVVNLFNLKYIPFVSKHSDEPVKKDQ